MNISCADLQSLKHFKDIKLVAGKKGLHRQITWPFICTTSTVSQWLHGGELLFITGAGLNTDELSLCTLLEDCIKKKLAGMVIVTGDQYITTISQSLIYLADKYFFPLFEMPWDLKLIDVTQEISELIIKRKEKSKQSQYFLERLLFYPDETESLEDLSRLHDIPLKAYRFIAIIHIQPNNNSFFTLDSIKNDVMRSLSIRCNSENSILVTMPRINDVICFASADTEQHVNHLIENITSAFNLLDTRYENTAMQLVFGRVCNQDSQIQNSFQDAKKALKFMKKGIQNNNVLHYSMLGIYKLFYTLENVDELRIYCNENIGCLIESDRKHSSELLNTLRCYLYNNCNLIKTAQALFIHRNTLIYRLNTIKNLINRDLDDAFIRFELFLSILAIEFLGE